MKTWFYAVFLFKKGSSSNQPGAEYQVLLSKKIGFPTPRAKFCFYSFGDIFRSNLKTVEFNVKQYNHSSCMRIVGWTVRHVLVLISIQFLIFEYL